MKKDYPNILFIALGISVYLLFLFYYMNRSYPIVGEDYSYFLPQMVDNYLHYQKNGFSIQWFTPSFGGGLPAYPNPQNIQFSLPQILVFFVDPWWATQISISIYSIVGYFACYYLGRDILKLGWKAAVLGALFFITTGFYIQHNLVGHLGYQVFPLAALFAYLIFTTKWKSWQQGIMLGLLVSIFIYEAGFYTLIILGLTLFMIIPLVYLLNPDWYELKRMTIVSGVGGITATFLSMGKIYAVMKFMQHFPRVIQDQYYSNFFESFSALIVQGIGVPLLAIPYRSLTNDPNAIDALMKKMVAGGRYAIWEKDVSISPVLVLIIIFSLIRLASKTIRAIKNRTLKLELKRDQVLALFILFLGIWLAFEITSARGIIYNLIKDLSLFRSLRANIRYASSFLLPLAILGAYLVDKEFAKTEEKTQGRIFTLLYLATCLWLGVYFLLPNELQDRNFNLQETIVDYQNARQGEEHYVAEVMDISDYDVFSNHATSLNPYEPVFGYGLVDFATQLVPGSIYIKEHDYYNLTNPMSLVYGPEEPFTRFSVGQEEMLEQFVNYKQPEWDIPRRQLILNAISGGTFLGILGYSGLLLIKRIKSSWGKRKL